MLKSILVKKESTILICDDSNLILSQLQHFLETMGYKVISANNGTDAIASFATSLPDVILMDDDMPGMNGFEATKHIVSMLDRQEDLPIIMMTEQNNSDAVVNAFNAGAIDYISKPIDFSILNHRLKRIILAKNMSSDLKNTTAFTKSVIDNAADSIITVNPTGAINYVNPAGELLLKLLNIHEFNQTIESLFMQLFKNQTSNLDLSKLVDGTYETECLTYKGNYIPIEISFSKFLINNEYNYTLIMKDISERKEYEARIRKHAFYDSLTGLPNRVLLKERFEVEINRTKRTNTQLGVFHIDIDRFRLINDTMGHLTGDELLKFVSSRMMTSIRKDDFIARIGGDDFLILIPGLHNDEHIGKVATNILDSISKPFSINGHEINITGSIGISICPDDGSNQESLITNADIALYRAKESPLNDFKTYTPELSTKALARMEMEYDLKKAVENNEFLVYYQPKVNTITEEIIGMEALVRWMHPVKGLIPPNDFIPLAEETGVILKIGHWVLTEACNHNKRLQNQGFAPLVVSVNLSMRQFEQQNFIDSVKEVLDETNLDPQYLDLEITESIAMLDITNTMKVIETLQAIGVRFSIDDFGTGYSSLSQLGKLSVDNLKIDKSFISNMENQLNDTIIASSILSLGKNLHMKIVAEGVENMEHVAFLKENLCDEMQGYYYGKPMPIDEFVKLLERLKK